MLFNTKALLSLVLVGVVSAAPSAERRAPPSSTVSCTAVGVHTPGRSPPSPDRTAIEISGAFSEYLWQWSTWDGSAPDGGVWGDRPTYTVREDGVLDVKLTGWRVVEISVEETKEHLEATGGVFLPSYNFASFDVHEISCVTVEA